LIKKKRFAEKEPGDVFFDIEKCRQFGTNSGEREEVENERVRNWNSRRKADVQENASAILQVS
jgi:hypothetical protein